jgi:WD40 repeat protein
VTALRATTSASSAPKARPALKQRRTVALGEHVSALSWSSSGEVAIAATLDGLVHALPVGGAIRPRVLAEHPGGALTVDVSPDDLVATGGQDGHVRIVDLADGARIADHDVAATWVEHVRWSPNGTRLAAAAGKIIRFWRRGGAPAGEFRDHPGAVTALWWNGAGETLTTACADGLRLLKPNRRRAVVHIPWSAAGTVLEAVESPDARYIAMAHLGATLSVLQVSTGRSVQFGGFPGKIRRLVWSPDARALAVASASRVAVFGFTPRGPERERARVLRGHEDKVTSLIFVPTASGALLASACENGRLCLWSQPKRFRRVGTLALRGPIDGLYANRMGSALAVSARSGALRFFSIDA